MTPQQLPNHSSRVRAYYEQNSAWFQWVGRRQQTRAIHRPVWAAGIDDRQSALSYVNDCIAGQVQDCLAQQPHTRLRFVDLGCGFGDTIQYLVRRFGAQIWATGVTVSAQQAQAAQHTAQPLGAAAHSAFVEADFHALPLACGMDLACSVEAFAHAGEPERYFAEVARLLKPGGRLILCDDFRADEAHTAEIRDADRRWIDLFKAGWRVPHLLSPQQVTALAQRHQLHKIEERDFSPYLHMRRFADALLPLFERAVSVPGRYSPVLASVVGGWALEHAIRRGHVTYRFLVFEKRAAAQP